MYQNRHAVGPLALPFALQSIQGSSHNNQVKDRIPEFLDGLREEFNALRQQLQSARVELEKHAQEREGIQRQLMSYYEGTCSAGIEIAKHVEITKRLVTIIQHSIQHLPPEHQPQVMSALERARNVTPQGAMKPEELNAMAAHFGMGKMPMMNPLNNPLAAAMAAASTSQAPSHTNNSTHSTAGRRQPPGRGRGELARRLGHLPPRSGTGTPLSKRPKTELDETDGELEIDVQNDDAALFTQPSASHTNGTSHKNAGGKNGRESAQSMSSRDSSATPKSSKQQNAALAAMASLMPPHMGGPVRPRPGAAANRLLFPNAGGLSGHTNGEPPYAYKSVDGGVPQPVQFPADALEGANIPKNLTKMSELHHGEVVCAVTMSPSDSRVYTGGQGVIKVWDLNNSTDVVKTALQTIDCNIQNNYVRSCKLLPDNKTLLVGGESSSVVVIDLETAKVLKKLDCEVQACYALVISADGRSCYSCCADGNIIVWDLTSFERVAVMEGHKEGASCVDLSADGSTLWTGGLDNTVCSWDVAERRKLNRIELESQVFSLGCSPTDDFVAVGMESSRVELLNTKANEKFVLHQHDNCVLVAPLRALRRVIGGARLVKTKEATSILCCDISADDKYIVSGSGDKKASVYEVSYDEPPAV
ncbi:Transcription factor unc-37 [Aphelenchoides fujianensis]|nr:Transcription factor unc-37 [Aphelenchoides fujianensis]